MFSTQEILLFIDQMARVIIDALVIVANGVQRTVINIGDQVKEHIDGTLGGVDSVLAEQNNAVLRTIETGLQQAEAVQKAATGQIVGELQRAERNATERDRALTETLSGGIQSILNPIETIIDVLGDGIDVAVENNIRLGSEVITDVTSQVQQIVADENDTNEQLVDTFKNTISDLLETFIQAELLDQDVSEVIGRDIVQAILTNAGNIEANGLTVQEAVEYWATSGWLKDIGEVLGGVWDKVGGDAVGSIVDIAESIAKDQDEASLCLPDLVDALPDDPFLRVIVGGIVTALEAATMPIALAQQRAQPCLQADGFRNPWNILQPGDVADALHRGVLSEQDAVNELKRNGFGDRRIEALLQISRTIPDITLLFSMWFRQIISTEGLDASLNGLGYNEEFREALKQTALFIPPVQDLITMAVREVFSPEIAQAQGQFEDFPDDFAFWAAQQGVTEEWAQNYWAAHWQLPSVQMGYEMLHRGVIDEEQLKGLMRSLDIMPGWRDELIEISYAPYTRVDIRRMNKLGVLDAEQVKRAYMDIGYNEERAETLKDFTLELNKDDEDEGDSAAIDLTRSNILEFYRRDIITRTTAEQFLLDSGINQAATDLWLQNEDLKAEIKERDDAVDLILDSYRVDEISYERAQDLLNGLSILTGAEINEAILDLRKLQIGKTKTPSREDLDKMVAANLIDKVTYLDVLENAGWSQEWSNRFYQLATGAS